MRNFLLTPVPLGFLFILGCGQNGLPPAEGERVQDEESAIIGGSADTTHPAVVAVLGPDFSCTGTVIQVKGTIGYVLTAAHCCPANDLPNEVFVGTNYNNPNTGVSHAVVPGSVVKDPCYQDYAGSTDDVCMLRFSGATAATEVIPVVLPQDDNLAIGTPITYVGYGLAQPPYIPDQNNPGQLIPNPNLKNNTIRNKVDKTVSKVDTYFVEYANASASGTCQGDSGGPGLVMVNGKENVASVTSFGDQACTQLGSSVRTSAVYEGFIAPYLADQVPNPTCPAATDCNACSNSATQNGQCASVVGACLKDAQCSALAQCYQTCNTISCLNACRTKHTGGLTKYVAIESCICDDACKTACGSSATCTAPKCGLKVTDTTCTSCVETTCCAEAWECQADAACKKCFGTTPPAAGCATNANAAAYYACAKDQCGCAVDDPVGGTTAASTTAAATTGSGDPTTSGAGGSEPTTAGAGGGAATTTAAGTGGSGSSGDVQVGGCSCSTTDSGPTPAGPFAALALGIASIVARRRRAR